MLVAFTRVSGFWGFPFFWWWSDRPAHFFPRDLSGSVSPISLVGRAAVHPWSFIGYFLRGVPLTHCKAVLSGFAAGRVNGVMG